VLILVCCVRTSLAGTPAQALIEVQRAVDGNDEVLLEKFVDLRAIIARGVDVFVADYAAHPSAGEGDPLLDMLSGGLGAESGSAVSPSVKSLLVEEARRFVVRGVASGQFSGRPPSAGRELPEPGILSALFADVSTGRKELREVRVQRLRDGRSTAAATLFDHGAGRGYPVLLALSRQPGGFWKVTDVENLENLVRLVRREAGGR
jgi:hypothetical protein